jgi:hypothetical protein
MKSGLIVFKSLQISDTLEISPQTFKYFQTLEKVKTSYVPKSLHFPRFQNSSFGNFLFLKGVSYTQNSLKFLIIPLFEIFLFKLLKYAKRLDIRQLEFLCILRNTRAYWKIRELCKP